MGQRLGDASVDLFWLPLGAGGRFVRWNGRLYEWWVARREHRTSADLYHCGLMICLDDHIRSGDGSGVERLRR
jgi:hypothetical protein